LLIKLLILSLIKIKANELARQKMILGITGGIAAYKINYLVRDFIKSGAEVKVIMTKSAEDFAHH
jgi:phosphopantothenoylcysteine decarboxylase/phosphopantothenate--cysteine ligase